MASIGDTTRPEYIYDQATDTWIPVGIGPHSHTPAAIGAISSSIVTAKGNIVTGTGSGLVSVTAVGNNGEVLIADSSTATGLRYIPATVVSNPVINSAFQIAQRGTSVSIPANTLTYTLDRWKTATGTNQACTVARVATGDTTNLPNIQYAMRYQRNSGQTGTAGMSTYQDFETINSIPYSGKTVTISVYARKGADYSPTSSILQFNLVNGTGTDQTIYSGYTGQNTITSNNMTLTTTWQRFTYTATVPTNSTQLAIGFGFSFTGTASTNDYFEVTGVQIDIGSVALPFRTNQPTYGTELAACQRYYYLHASGAGSAMFNGFLYEAGYIMATVFFPVSMRILPSLSFTSGTSYYNAYVAGSLTTFTGSSWNINTNGYNSAWLFASGTGIGGAAGAGVIVAANNASTRFAFSAEL